jgi:hypothetical protein
VHRGGLAAREGAVVELGERRDEVDRLRAGLRGVLLRRPEARARAPQDEGEREGAREEGGAEAPLEEEGVPCAETVRPLSNATFRPGNQASGAGGRLREAAVLQHSGGSNTSPRPRKTETRERAMRRGLVGGGRKARVGGAASGHRRRPGTSCAGPASRDGETSSGPYEEATARRDATAAPSLLGGSEERGVAGRSRLRLRALGLRVVRFLDVRGRGSRRPRPQPEEHGVVRQAAWGEPASQHRGRSSPARLPGPLAEVAEGHRRAVGVS